MTIGTPTPFHVATAAQQMARSAPAGDAVVFNRVAMVCMGVMAIASVAQVLQPILRQLNSHHEKTSGHSGRGR